MQARPELAIIIVNYRTADLTIDCLESLSAPGQRPPGAQVVVVDGHSGDGSADRIQAAIGERADWVTLLRLSTNGGFAYGNNRGIEHAKASWGESDYYLLLNPDTVVRPGALAPLLDFMRDRPRVGIAGARLEDPDGALQSAAFRFPSVIGDFESQLRFGPVSRLLDRWRVAPKDYPSAPARVDWVSGACMLVRSEVFRDIGGLDEGYFLYYEEVDFARRAARAGWECWTVPASRVVHLIGRSTGLNERSRSRVPAYWFASRRRYFLRNFGRLHLIAADLAWIAGQCLWRCREFIERRPREDPPFLLSDFVRHSTFGAGSRDRAKDIA